MDCTQAIELLSEYYAESLEDGRRIEIQKHFHICPPCDCVRQEVTTIVITAHTLRDDNQIDAPDPHIKWRQLNIHS